MIEVKKQPKPVVPVVNVQAPAVHVSPVVNVPETPVSVTVSPAKVEVLKPSSIWRFDVHRDEVGRISHIIATPQQTL